MPTRFCTARASGPDAAAALGNQLVEQLSGAAPQLVLTFNSPAQPLSGVAAELTRRFPSATVLGASTAGEFTEKGEGKQGVVACAIAGGFRVSAGIGRGLSADPERAVADALADAPDAVEGYPHRSALMLLDPLTGRGEEAVLIAGERSWPRGVPLAGGAAGDDLAMKQTHRSRAGRDACNPTPWCWRCFTRGCRSGSASRTGTRRCRKPLLVTRRVGQHHLRRSTDDPPAWRMLGRADP